VEFFVLEGGRLIANEIAPRPHNSGHYSIDACVTSQFEQQVRVMAGLPLGDTSLHCPAVMVNILGDAWHTGEPRWEQALAHPRVKLHLYGKREPHPGRKMGHYTVLGNDLEGNLALALEIQRALAASPAAVDGKMRGTA
jgi:5-(carboxyamino)imidazole ribonucleotide synthase